MQQLRPNTDDAANDLKELIESCGGTVSYELPDHHSLLRKLRLGPAQQNLAFTALDELRRAGLIRRQTDKVFPAQTYNSGRREVFVRKVVFTLT